MTAPTEERKASPVEAFLFSQMGYIRDNGSARAALRRGLRNTDDLTVNPIAYREFPANLRGNGYPSRYELAARDTLCLYASMAPGGKDTHDPSQGNLGATLQRVALERGHMPSEDTYTIRLHNRLVSARSRSAVISAVSDIANAAARYKVGINYVKLFTSLAKSYGSAAESMEAASQWGSEYAHVKKANNGQKPAEEDGGTAGAQ